jgi:hypothetical protein
MEAQEQEHPQEAISSENVHRPKPVAMIDHITVLLNSILEFAKYIYKDSGIV